MCSKSLNGGALLTLVNYSMGMKEGPCQETNLAYRKAIIFLNFQIDGVVQILPFEIVLLFHNYIRIADGCLYCQCRLQEKILQCLLPPDT
jgi:hypothetical protein